jgi:uncharacterized spore protein YtfJ
MLLTEGAELMADFDLGTMLNSIVSSMVKFSESVKVVADPIEVGDKKVIAAVVTRMGFGAGLGSGQTAGEEGEETQRGTGGGGGGMLTLTPVFLVVDSEGERLIVAPTLGGPLGFAADRIKEVVDGLMRKREAKAEGG